jgi:hypothetical protein
VFLTCIGGAEGDDDGPGGIALLDHNTLPLMSSALGDRPGSAALPLRPVVAPEPERADLQRVGQPFDDRERGRPGAVAGWQIRARPPLLGPRRGPAPATHRSGRPTPDGVGGPPVPRPLGDLGVRRCRDQHRGPVRLDPRAGSGTALPNWLRGCTHYSLSSLSIRRCWSLFSIFERLSQVFQKARGQVRDGVHIRVVARLPSLDGYLVT